MGNPPYTFNQNIYGSFFWTIELLKRGCIGGQITCRSCLLVVSDYGKIQCFELLVGKGIFLLVMFMTKTYWYSDAYNALRIYLKIWSENQLNGQKQKCSLSGCNSKEDCPLSKWAILAWLYVHLLNPPNCIGSSFTSISFIELSAYISCSIMSEHPVSVM